MGLIYLIGYAIHHTLDLDKKLDGIFDPGTKTSNKLTIIHPYILTFIDTIITSCVSALLNLYKQQSFYLAVSVQAIGLICKFYDISTLPRIKVQNVCILFFLVWIALKVNVNVN